MGKKHTHSDFKRQCGRKGNMGAKVDTGQNSGAGMGPVTRAKLTKFFFTSRILLMPQLISHYHIPVYILSGIPFKNLGMSLFRGAALNNFKPTTAN